MNQSPSRLIDVGLLIDVDELSGLLDGPSAPVVLDVRWNLAGPDGREEFESGHLPGARFVDLELELSGAPGAGGRHPLPPYQQFAHAMRRVGLDADTPVVLTDGASPLPAARLWWMLTDAGHRDVRLLDGGFSAWQAAGLPVETGPSPEVPPGEFTGRPGHRRQVDAAALAATLTSDPLRLIDVRAAERFTGQSEPVDPVGGHIPGAVNVPSSDNFTQSKTFRTPAELRARFDRLQIGSDAVVYCGSGITACQTLAALALAGIDDATLFAGSWSSWITDPDRPIATGA